jgi:hypothetical protein
MYAEEIEALILVLSEGRDLQFEWFAVNRRAHVARERGSKTIVVRMPKPLTLSSFITCLHELGHVHHGHSFGPKKSRAVEEFEAEMFMQRHLARLGIELPENRRVLGERYVAQCIRRGIRRGGSAALYPPEVVAFARVSARELRPR